MTIRALTLFAAICSLSASICAADPQIHLITIADTRDGGIGPGTSGNTKQMEDFLKTVARDLKVNLTRQDVSGTAFNCDQIKQAIKVANVGSDDVLIFYYSGHGFRSETNSTPFPELFCGNDAFSGGARLVDFADSLQKKGARLTITAADACNVLLTQPAPTRPVPEVASVPVSREQQFRRLFMKHKGTLVLSGAKRDQFSWYNVVANADMPVMGYFTKQFVGALDEATRPGKRGLWSEVVTTATKQINVQFYQTVIAQNPEVQSKLELLPD